MLKTGMIVGDRYEIIEQVGAGGMADVYKAKDQKLNRFVAVKVMKREFSEDKTFVTKFREEAQSAAGFTHPNIVSVYDVEEADGLYYIVMELVEGITLKQYIERKGKLPVREVISIAVQVSMGLEAAHNNKIIHRDIKPQNIIISKEGKAKLADFGIAKAATSEAVKENAVMGSIHYTSPEQARGDASDEKSDIYSLGITIYEMLTGKVPFDGDTTVSVALQHIKEKAPSLRENNPEISEELDAIVLKCIEKNPEDRYSNMGELINDLKKCLTGPEEEPEEPKDEEETAPPEDEEADEGQEESAATTLDRVMMVLGIVAALIIVGLAVYTGVSLYNTFRMQGGNAGTAEATEVTFDKETQRVMIDLTNMTLEQATEELNAMNLGIRQGGYDYSDEVESGLIMAQSEDAGAIVDVHTTILVTISNGPSSFRIPDVAGMTVEMATTTLEKSGLVVSGEEYDFDDSIDTGNVISTTPAAGTEARKGDTVSLLISRGKSRKEVTVPNLINKSKEAAIQLLEERGLVVGDITVSKLGSSSIREGYVLSQSYDAGKTVEEGTAVDLVLNKSGDTSVPTETPTKQPEELLDGGHRSVMISLDDLPDSFDGGYITLKLTQVVDGEEQTNVFYEGRHTTDDFPLTKEVEAERGVSSGVVTMFVDGNELEQKWSVTF